jgi:hypothetical protein
LLNGIRKENAAMASVFDGDMRLSQIGRPSAASHPRARKSQAAREATGELTPEDRVELSEAAGKGDNGQVARRICHLLVERLRQSIAADEYLTPEKIDGTVERLYRELFGP